MIRICHSKRSWLAVFAVFAALTPCCAVADDATDARHDQAVKFVFLGDAKPVLLHVFVEVDGRSAYKANESFYKRWFEYLDRDGNGTLSQEEAKRAPSDQTIKRLMQNGFYFPTKGQYLDKIAKKNGNQEISWAAFYQFYGRLVSPVQISVTAGSNRYSRVRAPAVANEAVGRMILAKLDANGDGKLSKVELGQAETALKFFDLNDDELIAANEIAGGANATGVFRKFAQAYASTSPAHGRLADGAFYYLLSGDVDSSLGLLLLSQYDRNFNRQVSRNEAGLSKEAYAKLDANRDGGLDAKELASWHRRAPDANLFVRLGASKKKNVELRFADKDNIVPVGQSATAFTIGDARIRVDAQSSGGSQMMQVTQSRTRYYLQQFKQFAKNRKVIEKSDLNTPQARVLSQMFEIVDQNQDGKMTEAELKGFTSMLEIGPKGIVTVSILPQGRQLFRMLDSDGNGSLSIRELRIAWKNLQSKDKNNDDAISQNEILREYQLTFTRGSNIYGNVRIVGTRPSGSFPRLGKGPKTANTPVWFQKMDRNGDGDISAVEFLGSRETFDQIDVDRDGLIAPAEARSADGKFRK